jgi:hypothetical protein
MSPKPFNPQSVEDYLSSFEAGMNSGISPILLPKNQLAFATNTTFRGGYPTHRPPFTKQTLSFGSIGVQAAFLGGLWQGGGYYKPDVGMEQLLASISGHLYLLTPTSSTWNITDVSIPGDLNDPLATQVWMFQSEKWMIVTDGTPKLPLFFDGTTSRRSIGNIAAYLTITNGPWTVPVIGGNTPTLTLAVAPNPQWPVGTPITGLFGEYVVASLSGTQLVLTRIDTNSTLTGTAIAAGAQIYPELPAGRMGAYGMGRVGLSMTDAKQFIIGDINGGPAGTAAYSFRDAVLHVSENVYLLGGGLFSTPGAWGDIRAMIIASTLDVSLGQGPLQIMTPTRCFSCMLPTDRTTWSTVTNPILTESLISNGSESQNATVNANGDIMFRAVDGIRSLILGRRDFNTWGNVPQSTEMDRILSLDFQTLLIYSSAIIFDNRFLMTCAPSTVERRGVFHPGLIALNFDPLSTLRGKAPSVYDGLWTGINTLQLLVGRFAATERAFAFAFNLVGNEIELFEIETTPVDVFSNTDFPTDAEIYDNGIIPILWTIESPTVFKSKPGVERDFLRMLDGEIVIDNLVGTCRFSVYYKPDQYPCWTFWFSWSECAAKTTDISKPQFRPRMGLGEPDSRPCDPSTNRPMREAHTFQTKLIIQGHCRILGQNYKGVTLPLASFAKQSCLPLCIDAVPPVPVPLPIMPGQAINPTPPDGATGVSRFSPFLYWFAGGGTLSYNVWFNGVFQANQTGTTFTLGVITASTLYTWRIDSVNQNGTTAGVTWSFTTDAPIPPQQAITPTPTNGATGVSRFSPTLSWANGGGAMTYNVYFNGGFQVNQAGTTFVLGLLAANTLFNWRIDSVNLDGITTGVTWSFTTHALVPPSQAITPTPGNAASGVSKFSPTLSWANGGGALTYDVWFNGVFQGNQAGTSFVLGLLADLTAYTWRIDAVNLDGTTAGVTWTFTTADYFEWSNPTIAVDWVDSGGPHTSDLATFTSTANYATVSSLVFPANVLITTITGLHLLPDLATLVCASCNITALDLSGNPALTTLTCDHNPALAALNVTGCTALISLACQNCALTTLDLHTCTALHYLACYSNPALTTLNVTGCTALISLNCHGCVITGLSLTGFTVMTALDCSTNHITTLDVSTCTALITLNCYSNATLATLNVAGLSALTTLNCYSCALTTLSVNSCLVLTTLDCHSNPGLASLLLVGSIVTVNCSSCALTSLIATGATALTSLDCHSNPALATLSVSGCTSLVTLNTYSCALVTLDVSSCSSLVTLHCYSMASLTTLTVTGCTALVNLDCYSDALTSINVSTCMALSVLNCYSNPGLATLTISGLTSLTGLDCHNCAIVTLDVSGCTALTQVSAGSNATMTTLNAGGCTALTTLNFGTNPLTSLDIHASGLTSLNVGTATTLVTLNAYSCTALTTIGFLGTSTMALTTVNVHDSTALTAMVMTAFSQWNMIALTTIDAHGCTALTNLTCDVAPLLTSINVTGDTALQTLHCQQCGLSTLDVTTCTGLVTLVCLSNTITSLDLHNCTLIKTVDCSDQGTSWPFDLNTLNVTGCTVLTSLNCKDNGLTSITGIGTCTALTSLLCYSNPFTSLDVHTCTALTALFCGGRIGHQTLATLNFSGCTLLDTLDCSFSALTSLSLTGLTVLKRLMCDWNTITTLDVSGSTLLRYLDAVGCGFNAAEVSTVLCAIAANGVTGGSPVPLVAITNNAHPTAGGITCGATLTGRGWTVTYDP